MSEPADLSVGRSAAIDLGDDRLRGRITNVEEPSLDGDLGRGFGEIAEGDHAGVGWSIGPREVAKLGRLRGSLGRIKTGADEIQYSAELEIVTDDLSKQSRVIFCLVSARSKVRDGKARLLQPQTGAGLDPVLRAGRKRDAGEQQKKYEKIFGTVKRT